MSCLQLALVAYKSAFVDKYEHKHHTRRLMSQIIICRRKPHDEDPARGGCSSSFGSLPSSTNGGCLSGKEVS